MPLYRVFRELKPWKLVEAKDEEQALRRVKGGVKANLVVPTSVGMKLPRPKARRRR